MRAYIDHIVLEYREGWNGERKRSGKGLKLELSKLQVKLKSQEEDVEGLFHALQNVWARLGPRFVIGWPLLFGIWLQQANDNDFYRYLHCYKLLIYPYRHHHLHKNVYETQKSIFSCFHTLP